MYQSIEDDIPDADPGRRPLWAAAALGGALLLAALWVLAGGRGGAAVGTSDPIGPEPEARQAYLQALGETDPALRRARLTDFLVQHPDNPRTGAARAQLAVLDGAADRDWQAVLTLAYDPRIDVKTRRAAVARYQDQWGRYLGARDADVEALLAELEARPPDVPDRTLPRDPDQYAGVPDDRLAGGRGGYDRPRIVFRPSPGADADAGGRDGDVIAPRVRRNATPRYPRRALRRGEEAVVTLSLTVDREGRVAQTELVGIEADRYADDFIRAAERAALRTRFEPQTVGGVPVEARGIRKRYRFELD
ncbi:MAG: energy transducer TonB [Pseudomonadota bacterium]